MPYKEKEMFHMACLDGETRVLAKILKKNSLRKSWVGFKSGNSLDLNCLDECGRSGLVLACTANNVEAVRILLTRPDIGVNIPDMYGETALMYACKHGDGGPAVKLLLQRREIDIDATDDEENTAEDYALIAGNKHIVQMIREERAKRIGGVWSISKAHMLENNIIDDGDLNVESSAEILGDSNLVDLESSELQPSSSDSDLHQEISDTLKYHLSKKLYAIKDNLELKERQFNETLEKLNCDFERGNKALEELFKSQQEALQEKHDKTKQQINDEHKNLVANSKLSIQKLTNQVRHLDVKKLLENQTVNSVSDLECPVCLEEMRPPVRIWQCGDGHAICEPCRKQPHVKCCPTCRQPILGRNILAEKLAKSLYGSNARLEQEV